MEKLKDFIYNKNDIIIAIVILLIASIVIYSRIGAIMKYPETVATQNEKSNTVTEENKNKESSEK